MRLLLDTHIWIWNVAAPDRLSKRLARILEDQANELWLSPASIWELGVLVEKKRIELDDDLNAWVSRTLSQTTFREAPLTNDVALAVSTFKFSHRDPVDHFLAASARVFDLTLVTEDLRLIALESQGIAVLSGRA